MTVRKRFIAGAICPACQQQDTLMMWREDPADACQAEGLPVDKVECVNCHYHMSNTAQPLTAVPPQPSAEQRSAGQRSAEQRSTGKPSTRLAENKGQLIGLFHPD